MNDTHRYKLSYTAASLVLSESHKVAEVFLGCRDWKITKELISQNNLLQSRTTTRSDRMVIEIVQRLALLDMAQLEFFVDANLEEQRLFLWYVVCLRYRFLREFAQEVLHQKFLAMDMTLTNVDYRAFYNRKMDWHIELEEITESTKQKLQSNLFKMLRDAGILDKNNRMIRVIPSSGLVRQIQADADFSFQIYPALPADFEGLI